MNQVIPTKPLDIVTRLRFFVNGEAPIDLVIRDAAREIETLRSAHSELLTAVDVLTKYLPAPKDAVDSQQRASLLAVMTRYHEWQAGMVHPDCHQSASRDYPLNEVR
ncbi:hypothetical protein [Dongia deserti]|uniref:hypothetical protein n=1 Tax=Dongia deserti TaxID=2268030 RepID=UPI000E6563F0|nr:hypothetical protein [Dongia deserti]